ncbi:MAG: thioredoxin family protein [Caldisericia bacterium]|nr:thioredoxin family protein [Caldisericia bacterium]
MNKLLTILLLTFLLTSCNHASNSNRTKATPGEEKGYEMFLFKNEEGYVEFYEAIKSGHMVIAKFGLDICTGCIEANQILMSLMPTYDKAIYFSKVDLMEDREAEKNYNIKMMPTIIFFGKDGKEFYRLEGTVTKELIVDKIESICWSY